MGMQSAQRHRRSRQVMALIAPPSFVTRTPEDTRAHRVMWMVEERFRTIVRRNALVRGNSTRLDEAVAEARARLAAIRDYFAGGELPPAQGHPVGIPVRMLKPIETKDGIPLDKKSRPPRRHHRPV